MRRRLVVAIVLAGFYIEAASPRAQTISSYRIEQGAVPTPLTGEPGNPARGRQIVRDMAHVTCLLCHALPIPEEPDHGEIGPSLKGVGDRLTQGELRLRLIDSKAINEASIMPAYYRARGLNRVATEFRDRPIYTAQQIEDVVAYLSSLKE